MPIMPVTTPRWNPLRASAAIFDSSIDPALAAAAHVGCFKIFASKRTLLSGKFDDRFRQLHTCGPGFVHSRPGQHVRASRSLANAGIAVAREKWLAVAARFLQRLRSPRLQGSAFQITPQIRMKHEVLQVTIGRADRTAEPRRNKDANRRQPARDERRGTRKSPAQGIRWYEGRCRAPAHCLRGVRSPSSCRAPTRGSHDPAAFVRHSDVLIDLAPDCSHRAVAHYRQGSAQVHAGSEPCLGASLKIGPLIGEPHAGNGVSFHVFSINGSATGIPGQICTMPDAAT